MSDCTSVVYTKNKTQLSWPIEPSEICYKNHTGQWHDLPYKCSLHQKWNSVVVTDRTKCGMWRKPERERPMLKMQLNYQYRSGRVPTVMKKSRTMMWLIVYMWTTPKTKLSYPDRLDLVRSLMKTKQNNKMIDHTSAVYAKKWNSVVATDRTGCGLWLKQTWQWCDRSYRFGAKKLYRIIGTYLTSCGMWWKPERTMTWSIV